MNQNQLRVRNFMQRIPSQHNSVVDKLTLPTPAVRSLRASLMTEECFETVMDGLGVEVGLRIDENTLIIIDPSKLEFRPTMKPNLVKVADGLADQEVVCLGTAVVCGIDQQRVFDCVMDNNFLKLKTGTIGSNGKLIKAPDHPVPDVEGLLDMIEEERRINGIIERNAST